MEFLRIVEGFAILPSIDICWMTIVKDKKPKKIYDIHIAWLFWMVTTTNHKKQLKEWGY